MTIKLANQQVAANLAQAMQGDDVDAIALAWSAFGEDIANQIRADFPSMQEMDDKKALQSRGYRILTSPEQKFYANLAKAALSANPKQEFITILGTDTEEDLMPETIITDVMKYLKENRPLLGKIRFQSAGYSTKWIINDNSVQRGGWGEITSKITDEIKGAIKIMDMTQSKYSAFAIIPIDILDMGPTFIDAFIRATMAEAIALGLEEAIVAGSGVNMPCGLMRNPNGAFDQSTGYPEKEAVAVTAFAPAEYGALVALLAKTEGGKERTFSKVHMLCNMTDYLTKVMPATTVLTANGGYVNNLFPFATEVIPCSVVPSGKAVLCLLEDYTLAVGGKKNGVIEYDDSIGFLDHARTFRVVQHAAGRMFDNTGAQVLDISNLDPAYITVKNVEDAATV